MANEPQFIRGEGWQLADDSHPPGKGRSAYHVVYKTLRFVLPEARFDWPNLRIRTGHGRVNVGGMIVPGALQSRHRGKWILPESGHLVHEGEFVRYEPDINMQFQFKAWEEALGEIFFVEFILETIATKPEDRLVEGSHRLGPLLTVFELRFGPRVLGIRLLEELGEVFDDGHFNRELVSTMVGAESQYDVAGVDPHLFLHWVKLDFERLMSLSRRDVERVRLACDWYWTAIHASNPVDEYLGLWIVVETLGMRDTTDVRPVREALAKHVGGTPDQWRDFVGRLAGHRNALVHGDQSRTVTSGELSELRDLAEALLAIEMSDIDSQLRQRLLLRQS